MGKTLLPGDFSITDDMRAWADSNVPEIDIDKETERFCDYWRGNGKKMADWQATWRNWIRNSVSRGGYRKSPSQVRDTGRWAGLIARARSMNFRAPWPHESADVFETALKLHERDNVPRRDMQFLNVLAKQKRV